MYFAFKSAVLILGICPIATMAHMTNNVYTNLITGRLLMIKMFENYFRIWKVFFSSV